MDRSWNSLALRKCSSIRRIFRPLAWTRPCHLHHLSTQNAKAKPTLGGPVMMIGRAKPTTIVKAFAANLLIFALSVGAVDAADLTNPPPAPPSPEAAPHWYVKL